MIKRKYIWGILFFSLLGYLILTILFEDRLYPSSFEKYSRFDFDVSFYFNYAPKCLSRQIGVLTLKLHSNEVIIDTLTFSKRNCSMEEVNISIEITDMIDFNITRNNFDFPFKKEFNSNKVTIIIDANSMKNYTNYEFEFRGKVGDLFANYYDISSPSITRLFFDYSTNIFTGYLCGETCFNIIDGNWERQDPIFYKKEYKPNKKYSIASKEFFNVRSPRFLFTFNPKLRGYVLLQKIIDALILGIVAILLYEIMRYSLKEKSQFDSQKQKLMQLSIRNLRQIVNLERLNVRDAKKEELVKKIIEARKK